jgi:hypothetical protein
LGDGHGVDGRDVARVVVLGDVEDLSQITYVMVSTSVEDKVDCRFAQVRKFVESDFPCRQSKSPRMNATSFSNVLAQLAGQLTAL